MIQGFEKDKKYVDDDKLVYTYLGEFSEDDNQENHKHLCVYLRARPGGGIEPRAVWFHSHGRQVGGDLELMKEYIPPDYRWFHTYGTENGPLCKSPEEAEFQMKDSPVGFFKVDLMSGDIEKV